MMLENVTRIDAGCYTCHVENSLGGATSAPVELNIQCTFSVLYVWTLVILKRRVYKDFKNIEKKSRKENSIYRYNGHYTAANH